MSLTRQLVRSYQESFTPYDLADIVAYYRQGTGYGSTTEGADVETWADALGNGWDLSTPAASPSYHLVNNLPVIRFVAADSEYMKYNDIDLAEAQPTTWFGVVKLNVAPAANAFVFDGRSAGGRQALYNAGTSVWSMATADAQKSVTSTDTAWHTFVMQCSGATSLLRLDGVEILQADSGAVAADGITLGASYGFASFADMDLAELGLIGNALSATDLASLENHLLLIKKRLTPFTLAVIPDTQHYTTSDSATFYSQMQWILDNAGPRNIRAVTHIGDLVQNYGLTAGVTNNAEWLVADTAFAMLDDNAPTLPYGATLGDHDWAAAGTANQDTVPGQFINYFGDARYSGKSWYGGKDTPDRNHYFYFTANGRTYMVVQFEHVASLYDADGNQELFEDILDSWDAGAAFTWLDGILDANPTTPTIITTHFYTHYSKVDTLWGTKFLWLSLKSRNQVFMVLSGHLYEFATPGTTSEHYELQTNDAGNDVHAMLNNYQQLPAPGYTGPGDGWLRYLEFDEDKGEIRVKTYSTSLLTYKTGASSQFSLAMDFADRFDF